MPLTKFKPTAVQAEVLAGKAVKVFDTAIADVEKAIALVEQDIIADSMMIKKAQEDAIRLQDNIDAIIAKAEAKIAEIEAGKKVKGAKLMEYKGLLEKLKGILN